MLMEQELEAKFVHHFETIQFPASVQVIGSRQPSAAATVKGEYGDASAVLVVTLGFRSNDSFSLPTANVSGKVELSTLIESSANDSIHDAILEMVATELQSLHDLPVIFSQDFSTESFYATEFRLDGGSGKSIDRAERAFVESINFTIRGAFRA